ncbi:MAG: M48 family metalloprotease [PVC group bacterium]|nr:M48 family metalloprotease [PVC group bacterium]
MVVNTKADFSEKEYALSSDLTIRELSSKIPLLKEAANLVIKYWTFPLHRAELIGNAVKVSSSQIPRIHKIAEFCANRLNMQVPELFLKYDPTFNAHTYGTDKNHFILLHSSLVDAFNDRELAFIIGHEMGHIKSQHVLCNTILYFLTEGAAFLLQIITEPLCAPLMAWSRSAEFTADRAGLMAAMDIEGSLRALAKLLVGSDALLKQLNLKELIEQTKQKNFYSNINIAFKSHPYLTDRINELINYAGTKADFMVDNQVVETDQSSVKPANKAHIAELEFKGRKFCKNCNYDINNTVNKCPFCGAKQS